MRQVAFAVPVKLWAFVCSLVGVSLTGNGLYTVILTLCAFVYLALQRTWRLVFSYVAFYAVLAVLLYAIRYWGFHMILFSEFHVLMFWTLSPVMLTAWDLITTPPGELSAFLSRMRAPTPVILGLLVMFRFFPTLRAELRDVRLSIRNRGLTEPRIVLLHPLTVCEYVLVPLLLRVLQTADQLSVSAVVRGAECPVKRSSYFGEPIRCRDGLMAICWAVVTVGFLLMGGIR